MRPRVTETDAIVEAARQCIGRSGFVAASVDEIALTAGVSRATVYRYGGGKRALIRDVLLRECQYLMVEVEAAVAAATTGEDAVRALIGTAVAQLAGLPAMGRAIDSDLRLVLNEMTVDASPLIGRLSALLAPVLDSAEARGLLGGREPARVYAEDLIRFVLGLVHTPFLHGVTATPEVAADRAVRLFGPALCGHANAGRHDAAPPLLRPA